MKIVLVAASLMLLALHSVHGECQDVANCNSCSNPGPQCSECPDHYVMSADGKRCVACEDKCHTCELKTPGADSDDTVCTKCDEGLLLDDGTCEKCTVEHCLLCMKEGEEEMCTKCDKEGYTLSGGKCVGCPDGQYADDDKCKTCPSNAVKCTTGPSVSQCKNEGVGYVKSNDGKSCLLCIGCVKCALEDTSAECTECAANQHVSDGSCAYCTDDSAGKKCAKCGDEGECEECSKTYRLEDGLCGDCPDHCDNCDTEATTCEECSDEYGLNEDVICEECTSNCKTCPDGECTHCKDGYALWAADKTCKKCPDKCETCHYPTSSPAVGDEICDTCLGDAELALNSDDIVQCFDIPDGCLTLITDVVDLVADDNRPQCDTCDTDYVLDTNQNECLSCVDTAVNGNANCITCDLVADDDVECTACDADGWIIFDDSANGVCVNCVTATTGGIAECLTCTSTSATEVTCTACTDGHILFDDSADGVCVNCATAATGAIEHCGVCTASSGTDVTCTACEAGYSLFNDGADGVCVSCTTAAKGGEEYCKTCTATAADTVTCDSCADDAVVYETTVGDMCGKPKSCPTGCKTNKCSLKANNVVFCNDCDVDYRKAYSGGSATGKCTKCNENCKTCSTNSEDNTQIGLSCDDKYVLKDDACVACPENCAECSDGETCTTCDQHYGKDEGGSCVECIAYCDECDDADGKQICTSCSEEYFDSDEECVECPSNCHTCDYSGGIMECTKCKDEYVLNDEKCDKCPSNCKECSSATKCKSGKCKSGFAVNDAGECQDCVGLTGIANCATCSEKTDVNDTAHCESCFAGYTLKDGLHSGEHAECISTSELSCGIGITIVDKPAQCADDGCEGLTVITDEKLCALACIVCGDLENDVFVTQDNCPTENGTANFKSELCPSGVCTMKTRQEGSDKKKVAGGCMKSGDECKSPGKAGDCQSKGTDPKIEDCPFCCNNDHFCTEVQLKNADTGSSSHAVSTSMSLLMLSSCSITVLTMLLQHISY